jgi:hypothetical protein
MSSMINDLVRPPRYEESPTFQVDLGIGRYPAGTYTLANHLHYTLEPQAVN